MIVNRTATDVSSASDIRENYIKKFKQLSESQITTLERGMLTYSTLNRIEEKQTELKNLFNELGYWNTAITNKNWALGDEFTIADVNRIVENEKTLVNSFFTYSDTPDIPSSFLYFEDTNAIEKILEDLDIMINDIKSNYRICGTFECGSD